MSHSPRFKVGAHAAGRTNPLKALHLSCLLPGRRARRWLQRLLTVVVILTCLLQPVSPALAHRSQPADVARRDSSPPPRDDEPSTAAGGMAIEEVGASGDACDLGPVPGIRAYVSDPGSCASPSAPEGENHYFASVEGVPLAVVEKDLYFCSSGATVHLDLWVEVQGGGVYQLCGVSVLRYGQHPEFQNIDVPATLVEDGGWYLCRHSVARFSEDVYFPPGKYVIMAEAGCGGYCAFVPKATIYLSLSAATGERAYAKEGCLANSPTGKHGDPVDTSSGNFTHQELDFAIPTRGLPLQFERSYNSQDTKVGPLGRGWTHNYNMQLDVGSEFVTLTAPRGSRLPFYNQADGSYCPGPGVRATLVHDGDGTYTLTQADQVTYFFDANGRLTALDDGKGNTTTLSYSGDDLTGVTAPDGRSLVLTYDQGRITSVTDPLSRTMHYTYTADTLTGVTDLLGQTWGYGYDAQGRMTSLTDPEGRSATNEYDSDDRVIVQTDRLDRATHFTYEPGITLQADAEGNPLIRTIITDPNGDTTTHTYTPDGHLASTTDALGNKTAFEYDSDYNISAVTDALGRTTRYTWNDCACQVATVEDPLGHVTHMEYDDRNNLLSITDPLTRTTHLAYDGQNNLIAITNTLGYTSTYTNDAYGQLTASVDANGRRTEYGYDAYGNQTVITDTLGNPVHMSYDLAGQLTGMVDANGHPTSFQYDAAGRLITATNALQDRVVCAYDSVGNVTSITDANQRTTGFAYDAAGQLITLTNALSGRTIFAYDAAGQLARVSDANGKATQYGYDEAGRLTTVTDALEGQTAYAYDAVGNPTGLTDARSKTTAFTYDALNRITAVTDPLGHTTHFAYDAVGNTTSAEDPTGVLLEYHYDPLDRLEEVWGPLGRLVAYSYDPVGNVTAATNPNGHTTLYTYDPLDRLETVRDPLEGLTVYGYDAVGNLTRATDAESHTTHYSYDALNRLLSATDPLSYTTRYAYDAVGNTTVITDADQLVTTFSYDDLHRLMGVQYPDGSVGYTYDAVGNRLSMTDGTGTTTYDYDALYRPLTITAPYAGPLGYRYDAVGNRTQTLYPGGEAVSYDYDDAGRLVGVSGWDSQQAAYAYDDAGRVRWQRQPNGVQTDYGYDPAGRLVRVDHSDWDGWLASYDYTLDSAGKRVTVSEATGAFQAFHLPSLGQTELSVPSGAGLEPVSPGGPLVEGETITYSYDDADRLIGAGYASGDYYGYGYDSVGNRTVLTTTAGTTGYVYDDGDRLVSVDGVACAYDNRGNLLSDGTWSYTYDAAGRMVRAETITATQVYTYNGVGLLVAQSIDGVETTFTWDQALAIPQVLCTSDGVKSLYGLERLGVLEGGAWQYPQHDALGSVRQWTDAAGAVLATQAYSPFGVLRTALGPAPWGFTGEWHDPGGLVYLRARWYNPAWGRFSQVDPWPGQLGAPATQHPYAYVLNNPASLTDPSGEVDPITVAFFILLTAGENAVSYIEAHSCQPLGEILREPAFWRSVGGGALRGVAMMAVASLLPALLPAGGGVWGAIRVGAISAGAEMATYNLLTGRPWHRNVGWSMIGGGAVAGALHSYLVYESPYQGAIRIGNMLGAEVGVGYADVPALDEHGRARTVIARITPGTPHGTGSRQDVTPPGLVKGVHDRAHLYGSQLGGRGEDPRNIVALTVRANRGVMRGFEKMVRDAVNAGEIVLYQSTPIYRGASPAPIGVTLHATGSAGFELHVTVLNIP